MTEKNRVDLKADVVSKFPTTGTKNITAAILRPFLDDTIDSARNVVDDLSVSRKVDIAASATLTNADFIVNTFEVDCTLAPVNLTLPLLSTVATQKWEFVKIDSTNNKLTLDGNGAEEIAGELTTRVVSQFDSMTLVPNTSQWFVLTQQVNGKVLFVDRNASGVQSIPTGVATVVEFDNIVVDSGDFYDASAPNYDYTPGNAVFQFSIGVEILQLDANNFVQICIRKNGTPVACTREYSTFNNQDITATINILDSNVDPSPGVYDVTIEHNQGANLDISDVVIKTYWKAVRIA